jgi:hypothetical protein
VHHLAKTLVSLADSASQSFCVHGSERQPPGLAARAFERAHLSCYCGKRLCRLVCLQANRLRCSLAGPARCRGAPGWSGRRRR